MRVRWLTVFLDFTQDAFDRGLVFWAAVTGATISPVRGRHEEFATLLPGVGDAILRVQRLGSDAARAAHDGGCHLDLHVDGGVAGIDAFARHAQDLAAVVVDRSDGLVVLDSPGGFRFCVVGWNGESTAPAPVTVHGVGPSSADQLSLDVPEDSFDAECGFWAALTGWPLRGGDPEFSFLERAPGVPVRLLFQRRHAWVAGDRVTAHVDIAAGAAMRDVAVAHTRFGASDLTEFAGGWVALRDPVGRPYCVTGRDPVTRRMAVPVPGADPAPG